MNWLKLPSLTALRAFSASAQAGSFSAAARGLNVTHAAVAQQVSALEAHLGVTLIHRSPQGIALTPEGTTLAASLNDGFSSIAEGVRAVHAQEAARPIRVTTTSFFVESMILPHIAGFWAAHPGTEVSFTPTDTAVDILAQGFDVAMRAGAGPWPGLTCRHLFAAPTHAYAAAHLVDDPTTDWSALPWLIPRDSQWERDALRQSGIDLAGLRTLDVGNPTLEISACEDGLGLLVEAATDIAAHLARGTLKRAPIPITFQSDFFVVTPPWKPRPAVQAFVDWLIDTCQRHAPAS